MTMDARRIIAIRLMKKRAKRFYWARTASHSTSIKAKRKHRLNLLEVLVMKSAYKLVLALAVVALLISVQPAAAHHSGAGFNSGKIVELKGTVKEFQFKNPHTW